MATFQTKRDPLLRNVSPTPSKIPVRSKRCPPLPTVKACALDQENQDPKRLEQKFSVQRPHVDSAGPRRKAAHQTEKSERLVGSAKLRNPLEELGPSPRGQNVRPGPSPQTEVPGVVEFVADPEALATILSGEGVKSCRLGRQPSLAQRVLVRGSQGGTIRRGQGARVSAYSAPRTPTHRLDPEVAQLCPIADPGPPVSCHRREPEIPEPTTQEQPKVSEAFPQVEAGPLQVRPQGQTGLSETSSRAEPGASEASPEPSNPESSPQPCCSLWAPATTSVIFSSQRPLCASPPIRSLQSMRPPTGQTGPSSLAPGTLALRQRLKACLTAIHCFHEARLDDECAFYTSRAPPSVPSRVCTNPVATLLEWQEALCFIPVGSAALRDSPS
uniref:Trophinin associated protein n=1 Tax=Rousettus aegyptiacus TaxID=9407 RepID=A0A7J8JPV0_ROUAE|nr:trophinin associated protein [Rousettus aegyptiacus]